VTVAEGLRLRLAFADLVRGVCLLGRHARLEGRTTTVLRPRPRVLSAAWAKAAFLSASVESPPFVVLNRRWLRQGAF
jgi:hypothetical protein